MPDPVAQYSFIPWLRQGTAAGIAEADHLGGQPDAGPAGRAGLIAELILDYVPRGGGTPAALPALEKRIEILGPGDVATIKRQAILRSEPYPDAVEATPGELAYVEFYEEDFPWRYTPARVATPAEDPSLRHKLRPWIALLVLRDEEFTLTERLDGPPILALVAGVELPPVDEAWAWAHAQVSGTVAKPGEAPAAIAEHPDHALSRLLCPRLLDKETAYHAFVVPAFETGRLAGLGLATAGIPAQKPSWGTAAADADPRYPVYFRWSFKTGTAGDFETLVRKLVAGPAGEQFGKRTMDIGNPGYGISGGAAAPIVGLEGALRPPPPTFQRDPFPDTPGATFADQLAAIIDLSETLQQAGQEVPDDPIVTPPAYARWHADVARIADAASETDLAWLVELNLDPRSRAAAGLGTEIIRQRQEELMERAWNQVGRLEDANQRLRESELATVVGEALFRKHVAQEGNERLLILTAATQRGLQPAAGEPSVRGVVDASRVPAAVQSPAFKRITRPQRRPMRRLTGSGQIEGLQDDLLDRMNGQPGQALSAAPPKDDPASAVPLTVVQDLATTAVAELKEKERQPKQLFAKLVHADLAGRQQRLPPEDLGQLAVPVFRGALHAALVTQIPPNPPPTPEQAAVAARVRTLIDAITAVGPDGPETAKVTVTAAAFAGEFGDEIAGKAYGGVTIMSAAPPTGTEVARMTDTGAVAKYGTDLQRFDAEAIAGRPLAPPPPELPSPAGLSATVRDRLQPKRSFTDRAAAALPGLGEHLLGRDEADPRRLRPVMAYPIFPDPMFEPLRRLSQDHILPNIADLPRDTITLLQPNQRFIEAFMAGLNDELARELLWREYPTDQRGSYFRSFWDIRDALGHPDRADVKPLHQWTGPLGNQGEQPPDSLVLVIRGELLQKYPNTVVYAQEATWPEADIDQSGPRTLDPDGRVEFPILTAKLEPDVAVYGFDLDAQEARGHRSTGPADPEQTRPGWFFVLKERPGQVRFGLDPEEPEHGFNTWDDLSLEAIQRPSGTCYLQLAANAGLAPQDPGMAAWARTSADMAAILFQNPVLYARHAEEMLPA